jgi:hypothetical protein
MPTQERIVIINGTQHKSLLDSLNRGEMSGYTVSKGDTRCFVRRMVNRRGICSTFGSRHVSQVKKVGYINLCLTMNIFEASNSDSNSSSPRYSTSVSLTTIVSPTSLSSWHHPQSLLGQVEASALHSSRLSFLTNHPSTALPFYQLPRRHPSSPSMRLKGWRSWWGVTPTQLHTKVRS